MKRYSIYLHENALPRSFYLQQVTMTDEQLTRHLTNLQRGKAEGNPVTVEKTMAENFVAHSSTDAVHVAILEDNKIYPNG